MIIHEKNLENLPSIEHRELKVVYYTQDMDEYKVKFSDYFNKFYIQPMSNVNTKECVSFVKQNPDWVLSAQVQKLIDVL